MLMPMIWSAASQNVGRVNSDTRASTAFPLVRRDGERLPAARLVQPSRGHFTWTAAWIATRLARRNAAARNRQPSGLEHDPERCVAAFGKDHAQTMS
jgi:hypothetical protein